MTSTVSSIALLCNTCCTIDKSRLTDVPRYVDHEERRDDLVEVATDLVARRGRAALTVRNLADALGTSTKVVSHYFDDMGDLLHATYTAAAERARDRLDAVVESDPTDVRGLIEALLPLD